MKIATWNVNSIRARITSILKFIELENPDIILFQELKCLNEQFPFYEFESLNYNIEIVGEKAKNGVAIFSKYRIYEIQKQLPLYDIIEEDNSARYIEAYFDYKDNIIKIASIYVPNGGPNVEDERIGYNNITETITFENKMKFEDRLKLKFEESIKNNEIAFYCGDYNVCPNLYMDVYSPKLDGTITNTEQERQKYKELLNTGMIDIWRNHNKDLREYSWWGYRPITMFQKNQGYRIDSILATPEASKIVKNCYINKEPRSYEKPSDHTPMIVEI